MFKIWKYAVLLLFRGISMLQIKDVRKEYVTGDLHQKALDGVSLNLRDNEFVAILGPSGSGKTTLLNVIGGLDRYDSGDLVINDISTKKYSDRDWDSYRNHTIGFVFQSYNLIPHQNILSNVELALTISGISGSERRRRAKEALEKVGLAEHMHKKPNQLSGGQMQRVAIARALVNNPDILLADEPTGALDTVTSVQIMELLKEVATDRLVVMVTHNPDLAEQYATRIVRLSDGKITGDSDPFFPESSNDGTHKNMGRASMSFLTSLALSFNNLRTKKARTILTAFAGSIGIIGIALIMSLSNGARAYIKQVEEETLSEYPLTIQTTATDLSSFMQLPDRSSNDEGDGVITERQTLSSFFSNRSTNDLKSLKKFFESGESDIYEHSKAIEYVYQIDPQLYFLIDDNNYRQVNPDQSFTSSSSPFSVMSAMTTYNSVFSALPEEDSLYKSQYEILAGDWPKNSHELVLVISANNTTSDLALYTTGLKNPFELDEMIEAFSNDATVELEESKGVYTYDDFLGVSFRMIPAASIYEYDSDHGVYVDKTENHDFMLDLIKSGEVLTITGIARPYEEDTANILTPGICYPASLSLEVMEDAAESELVQKQLADPDVDVFTGKRFDDDEDNELDMSTLFSIDEDAIENAFSIDEDAISVDESSFEGLDEDINIDPSSMSFDFSSLPSMDISSLGNMTVSISTDELQGLFQSVIEGYLAEAAKDPTTDYSKLGDSMGTYLGSDEAAAIIRESMEPILQRYADILPDEASLNVLAQDVTAGLGDYIGAALAEMEDPAQADFASLVTAYLSLPETTAIISAYAENIRAQAAEIEITQDDVAQILTALYEGYTGYAEANSLPDPSKFQESFNAYINSAAGQQILTDGISKVVDLGGIQSQLAASLESMMGAYSASIASQLASMMQAVTEQISSSITTRMEEVVSQLAESIPNAFSVDTDAFANAIQVTMDSDELSELMMSLMAGNTTTYESNLKKLNYADEETPYMISIYPKNFEGKGRITRILEDYNARMEADGEDDKVISYADYVGTLMSSVTSIVDTISMILVAFVAISLIVSSIMIGIITYISVLERTKEIGILRALGASKRNISQVFNAETFIIGLLAGIMGVGIALLLLIPGNAIVHQIAGNTDVNGYLPFTSALFLIGVSVVLTLIGGLIPSRAAARKDPVTALRVE